MISAQTVVAAIPDQVSGDLADGDTILLSLKNGVYYGLNATGACIWTFIQQPRNVGEITAMLLETYDVDPMHCDSEVRRLLEELETHQLIEVQNPDGA